MFELSSSLGPQIAEITRDTFSGTSGFILLILGIILGFFVIEILINLFNKK